MKFLTIIPARGGSKGVLKKNIRFVGGKPLIAWTLVAVRNSSISKNFYVSTDDEEIAEVADQMKCPVLKRPKELALDSSQTSDVVLHAIEMCEANSNEIFDYILLLQPTTPLRTGNDIDQAIKSVIEKKPDSLVSVYRVTDAHPARMYTINDGYLDAIFSEGTSTLRQDLPSIFHRNGAIYICSRDLIVNKGVLWGGNILPYLMPKDRSINIDDEQDLLIADFLLSKFHCE